MHHTDQYHLFGPCHLAILAFRKLHAHHANPCVLHMRLHQCLRCSHGDLTWNSQREVHLTLQAHRTLHSRGTRSSSGSWSALKPLFPGSTCANERQSPYQQQNSMLLVRRLIITPPRQPITRAGSPFQDTNETQTPSCYSNTRRIQQITGKTFGAHMARKSREAHRAICPRRTPETRGSWHAARTGCV